MTNHPQAGFSLMEMAIVLIIMGIVAGAAMPSILKYREQARFKETKERQELIAHAAGAFAVMNHRLPCPADPEVPSAERGVERVQCADLKSAIGIVPYRDLGLTESQAKDAFGRYMTYVVPAQFRAGNEPLNVCRMTSNIPIDLKNQHGTPVDKGGLGIHSPVALLLVSQGPQGQNPSPKERANSELSMTFHDSPFSLSGKEPFRHIVKWVTGRNLITYYGKGSCEAPKEHSTPFDIPNKAQDATQPGLGDPFGRGH